jgi:hypothetical protein
MKYSFRHPLESVIKSQHNRKKRQHNIFFIYYLTRSMSTSDKLKRERGEEQVERTKSKKARDSSSVSRGLKSSSSNSRDKKKKQPEVKEEPIDSQPDGARSSSAVLPLSFEISASSERGTSAGGIQFSPQTGERMERCFSRIATKIGEEAKEDLQE